MKKTLLFVSALIATGAANAQISITNADLPQAGQSYINNYDTVATSYGTAGTNQTWNFSAWANQSSDTTVYEAASNLAGASNFSTATIGSHSPSGSDGNEFYEVTSTYAKDLGFYGDVIGNNTNVAVPLTPAKTYLTLPATYGTNFNGTAWQSLQFLNPDPQSMAIIDSIRYKIKIDYADTADAWGTVTTPAMANAPALRIKEVSINTDSIFYHSLQNIPAQVFPPNGLVVGWNLIEASVDTSYSYTYWANGHGSPIASVSFDAGDTQYQASWLASNMTTSIKEAVTTATPIIEVFPNPTAEKINITNVTAESYLFVFDVNGKMVAKEALKKNNSTINVSNYSNGTYTYAISPVNGGKVTNGKFVVSK